MCNSIGLVKPGTLSQCTKACYGLREAPKPWEEARDKTLTSFVFQIDNDEYSLRQCPYHPSLWFVVRAPCSLCPRTVRLPDDNDLPDMTVFGKHKHVAAFLVYVDDFLAAGPRSLLQPLLTSLLRVWKGSIPDFSGRRPGDVDTMRFLGLDGSFISRAIPMPSSKRCLTQNITKIEGQDPLEHTPVLRLVGVLPRMSCNQSCLCRNIVHSFPEEVLGQAWQSILHSKGPRNSAILRRIDFHLT